MLDKDKLFKELLGKSGKEEEELKKLIKEKIDELSGLITEEGAIHIIANELGIRLDSERKNKKVLNLVKISEIVNPKETVSFFGKVIRKFDVVNFSSSSAEGRVQSIIVGDETGVVRVTFWNDKVELLENVNEGDVLKIINGYSRENQDRIEVSIGTYSDIEVNPEGVKVEVKQQEVSEPTEKKISELTKDDRFVKVSGLIVDFDIPRYYYGCPECYKKVFQDGEIYKCPVHGEVQPIKVPVCSLSIDDGTGSLQVVVFRDNAEKITNLRDEEIFRILENIENYRNFVKEVLGKRVEIVGNVRENGFTGDLEIVVSNVLASEVSVDTSKVFVKSDEKNTDKSKEEKKDEVIDEEDILEIEEINIDDI